MKALSPKALAAARVRNVAALDRLNAKIAADKERSAARVQEREAYKRNRAPRSLDDLERLGMVIDIQALRRRGDVLVDGRWTAIAPPTGLRSVIATYDCLKLDPLIGHAQMIPLHWRKTVGPYSLVHALCACGRRALKLYPTSLEGGPWGCKRCSATGARRDSGDKSRGRNRVRIKPPIYRGLSGHLVCQRGERGRFLPRDKARILMEPPPSAPESEPVVHRPFGPCDWAPRRPPL